MGKSLSTFFSTIHRRVGRFVLYRFLHPFPRVQFAVGAGYRKVCSLLPSLVRRHLAWRPGSGDDYAHFVSRTRIDAAQKETLRRLTRSWKVHPKISLILPVYDVDPRWLDAAVGSVRAQIYENWELCIVDDASSRPEIRAYLNRLSHPGIKIRYLSENRGIAGASNAALQMATGAYVGLLDHDDELRCNALFEVVNAIQAHDPDMIYTDEDKISPLGVRRFPFFKPDWSPDLLRCQNYICHLTVIRKELIDAVGGFNVGFDGAQDYDLILRVTEQTTRIHHIPKILYSWREIESSTAINPLSKPAAEKAGVLAVNAHLKRRFPKGAVAMEGPYRFVQDVRFPMDKEPLVSIVVPTRDGLDYLDPCVKSVLERSSYGRYEIVVVDNNSNEKRTLDWFAQIQNRHANIRVIEAAYPFCWSKLNNHGMAVARGEVLIFLNNDTQVISRDWIERLAEQALRDDVGVVGPQLLYADGTLQHAGVVVGMGGWADHVFKAAPAVHAMSPFVSPMVKRNVLAVTGSCMVISRKTIDAIGPFDESFLVCGSDVEICLRAYQHGLNNIYDPFVQLYHYESKTRIPDDIPACDFAMSRKHYKPYWDGGDPFYNVNLSLDSTTPALRAD